MKTEKEMLSEPLANEVRNTILSKGKEISRIVDKDMAVFSLYRCDDASVVKEKKPLYAIFAHSAAYVAFNAPQEKITDNGLLVIGWEYDKVVRELAELAVNYEDQIKGEA
jgi:hypothetical protein